MINYSIEEKESFTVIAFGTDLKSHYTDYNGLTKEKSEFWKVVNQDGRLEALKALALNEYIFRVNEAVNNKMMHYSGVMSDESAPEEARVIQFPKGKYLVVKGEDKNIEELNNKLTGMAFGQALNEETNYAYVGGPNTVVQMGHRNGLVFGEMWIPVVKI